MRAIDAPILSKVSFPIQIIRVQFPMLRAPAMVLLPNGLKTNHLVAVRQETV